jgi:hypothetical protein|tara:strand:+ start:20927 stop:21319 length:393 start_codon:yes stop_codon:yes gene_type:complete
MGKLTNYIVLMSGLVLLFYFTGLIETSASATLLDTLLSPQSIADSPLGSKVKIAIGAIIALGGIAGGIIFNNKQIVQNGIIGFFMFSFFLDFLEVYNKLATGNEVLAILIISPLLLLYVITVYEWIDRRD